MVNVYTAVKKFKSTPLASYIKLLSMLFTSRKLACTYEMEIFCISLTVTHPMKRPKPTISSLCVLNKYLIKKLVTFY